MADTVRTPQQQRSIDKKKRIIEAGYSLFAKKGYYNTNTAEIAKEAGVSTGIVYGYFRDKRDILVEVTDIYVNRIFTPILEMMEKLTAPVDFEFIVSNAVDAVTKAHSENAAIHEALHSLSHTDEAIRLEFISLEDEMNKLIVERLSLCGVNQNNLPEKVHLAIQTVQTYAHECVYDKHEYLSYPALREIVINSVTSLFAE